jgi:hypothetical protein
MDDLFDSPGMVPYPILFPEFEKEIFVHCLPRKVGKAKAGTYSFVEAYCVDKGCDCRRTTIFVFNDKNNVAAVIDFGFDPGEPLAGPFLNDMQKQTAAANDLLEIFVDLVNGNPDWVKGMYEHYRKVRKHIGGRTYRGKAFPKPEKVVRVATPPPEIEDAELSELYDLFKASVRNAPAKRGEKGNKGRPSRLRGDDSTGATGMADFIERYQQLEDKERFADHRDLHKDLRRYVLDHDQAGDELAALLPQLFPQKDKDEARFDAALRLLFDALETLRVELERRRPGAKMRMAHWQEALARHVFVAGVDGGLCGEVTHILLQTQIEILPELHAASTERMFSEGEKEENLFETSPEEAMKGLFQSFSELELDSPFELFDAFLQIMAVGEAEMQVALCAAMLGAEDPMIREAAALMLFHPQAEVREGVARQLATADGRQLTPETLRRLIIARNWFPEALRGHIDQAIAAARRARVECAPVPKRVAMTVHASGVDGAGAQSFQVIVPDGKGFVSCSLLLKFGVGVSDAFLIPLATKRELKKFLAVLNKEVGGIESSADYLDARLCQALAEGAVQGNVPSHWLVAIAEQLGRDQWRAIPFDPRQALAALRTELELLNARQHSDRARRRALADSADWPTHEAFAHSWFEDDVVVDQEITALLGKTEKRCAPHMLTDALLDGVLEKRRSLWLQRLVLTTFWLKSAKKPPIPWSSLFHVTEAVADEKLPLREIPLMEAIAALTLGAHLARKADDG